MQNNKISDWRMYFLSAVHILRIVIIIFFATCPLLFTLASLYFLFNSEWIKAITYETIGICTYFSYPMISSWFEECRIKFKNEVDEWSRQLDESIK